MNYIITGKGYISELVKQTEGKVKIKVKVKVISEENFRESELILKFGDKIYAPTESALEIILERSENSVFTNKPLYGLHAPSNNLG